MAQDSSYWRGTGRRKTAVARVRLRRGSGDILLNGRELDVYFTNDRHRSAVKAPLRATKTLGKYDVLVGLSGGGPTGQAEATRLGVARALLAAVESSEAVLRDEGYLTRDARKVERKKYGRRGARRGFQFSKR